MLARVAPHLRSDRAAAILRRLFGALPGDFAFRLWDGTEVRLGAAAPAFTVVITTPATFLRLLRDPSPRGFAEAYVESEVDIEGDLYAAMVVAEAAEAVRLASSERLRLLLGLWGRA